MRKFALAAAVLALISLATTAWGLFEIKNPLSGVWKSYSVAIGTIESTRDGNHILTMKLTFVPKESAAKVPTQSDASPIPAIAPPQGLAVGDALSIQVVKPDELCARVAKDQPVVIVHGIKNIIINIADDWYLAEAGNTPKILRIIRQPPRDFRGAFPGHTSDLIRALDELKAGKYTLLDAAPPRLLSTQVKLGAVAGVKSVAAISAGIDDKQHVLVYLETAEDAAMYTLKDGTLEKGIAVATQKERLAKHALKRSETDKNPPLDKAITITMGAFGADGSYGALAVLGDKLVRVSDWEKPTEKTDDDLCLLGSTLKEHVTEWKAGITDAVISTCDVNADGRDDAVIVSSKGSLVLLNRGFGVFLVAKAEGEAFKGALGATADPVTGGILVLKRGDDGTTELWHASTPKP